MNRFLEAASTAPAVGAFSPLADLQETDDAYVVEAEVPGIRREDIDVEISERELCISGEYKERARQGVLRRSRGQPAVTGPTGQRTDLSRRRMGVPRRRPGPDVRGRRPTPQRSGARRSTPHRADAPA
ncbi:Hsp20/alpha crystallin family protein [Streptomyces sp. NEAU-S7GS2]|uniref:Hsp20/alpha crystallin family protein n=1 Tax=Streptomyces sp. NEAU-S7GS2 TaxID=2202000 RepID=UPI001EF450BA|nr:Hsp20/alpha crystallin family protein [Streptomyces sp. NEAU-S7GS2]